MTEPTQWVSIARLIRPQGRRGEILCEILTDFPERFAEMQEAFLSRGGTTVPTPIKIEQSWLHKGRIVLKLAQVDSISAAELLRGAEIVLPAEKRMPLEPGAAYIGDLIGCRLIDHNQPGHPEVGVVQDVIQQTATTDLLVVLGSDGAEHWIPFAEAYLVRMDLEGRRLEMNLPTGLLQVNAALSPEERIRQQLTQQSESDPAEE